MKIYITNHGEYEDSHISLCTTDFDLAINHFINYSKTGLYNKMGSIEIWEDNNKVLEYGIMRYDVVNCGREVTPEEIKEDILKQLATK